MNEGSFLYITRCVMFSRPVNREFRLSKNMRYCGRSPTLNVGDSGTSSPVLWRKSSSPNVHVRRVSMKPPVEPATGGAVPAARAPAVPAESMGGVPASPPVGSVAAPASGFCPVVSEGAAVDVGAVGAPPSAVTVSCPVGCASARPAGSASATRRIAQMTEPIRIEQSSNDRGTTKTALRRYCVLRCCGAACCGAALLRVVFEDGAREDARKRRRGLRIPRAASLLSIEELRALEALRAVGRTGARLVRAERRLREVDDDV